MTQNLVDDEQFNSWILGRTPAHRWGTVQDLAGPAVWLASDGLQLRQRPDHLHRRRNDGGGLMGGAAVLPATAAAVVAHAAGDLRIEDIPVPAPAADEAVIEVAFGGICGSDLHYWMHGAAGESVLKAPMVLGHEIVGTVIRAAADGSGPEAGTARRGASRHSGSGRRPVSRTDRPNLSPGCTYLGSAARFPAHGRGLQPLRDAACPDAPAAAGGPGAADRGPGGTGQRRLARRRRAPGTWRERPRW